MATQDSKGQIFTYLQSQILMSVTTFGDDNTPWPAIVYFIADDDLNLYFISHPDDQHCRNIAVNSKVACAIYDSNQPNAGDKIGIQYSGTAEIVNTLSKVKWMVKLWNKSIAGAKGTKFDPKELLRVGESRVYKITPKRIKFFNTKDFPDQNFKVWE